MVRGHVVQLDEPQTIESAGGVEHSVGKRAVELEVVRQPAQRDRSTLFFLPRKPIREICRTYVGADGLGDGGELAPPCPHGRRDQVFQQFLDGFGTGSGFFRDHVLGVIAITQ